MTRPTDSQRGIILFVVVPIGFFWLLLAFGAPSASLGWGERIEFGLLFAVLYTVLLLPKLMRGRWWK